MWREKLNASGEVLRMINFGPESIRPNRHMGNTHTRGLWLVHKNVHTPTRAGILVAGRVQVARRAEKLNGACQAADTRGEIKKAEYCMRFKILKPIMAPIWFFVKSQSER